MLDIAHSLKILSSGSVENAPVTELIFNCSISSKKSSFLIHATV